jgi:pyridoxamine 5'-phosphate oxidase
MLSFNRPLPDPFQQFARWFSEALQRKDIYEPTAMCVSTVDPSGWPEARMVLLKVFDEKGFVFYTNLKSPKGKSLAKSPKAALTFFWDCLERQVRIQGKSEIVSDAEADAYWKTRPRLSQLGAWASNQSAPLPNRLALVKAVARLGLKYGVSPVPRPPHWTGVRVIPQRFEFWQGQPSRLHDRFLFERRAGGAWAIRRLYP